VQDVTSFGAHGGLELWRCLAVSQGQINHELLSQITHFTEAEVNVPG
jgi:hypothetical protein